MWGSLVHIGPVGERRRRRRGPARREQGHGDVRLHRLGSVERANAPAARSPTRSTTCGSGEGREAEREHRADQLRPRRRRRHGPRNGTYLWEREPGTGGKFQFQDTAPSSACATPTPPQSDLTTVPAGTRRPTGRSTGAPIRRRAAASFRRADLDGRHLRQGPDQQRPGGGFLDDEARGQHRRDASRRSRRSRDRSLAIPFGARCPARPQRHGLRFHRSGDVPGRVVAVAAPATQEAPGSAPGAFCVSMSGCGCAPYRRARSGWAATLQRAQENEHPRRRVTTGAYEISETPVTNAELEQAPAEERLLFRSRAWTDDGMGVADGDGDRGAALQGRRGLARLSRARISRWWE